MAFQKFMRAEQAQVASKDEHQKISDTLNKLGKTSAADLTEEERKKLSQS